MKSFQNIFKQVFFLLIMVIGDTERRNKRKDKKKERKKHPYKKGGRNRLRSKK